MAPATADRGDDGSAGVRARWPRRDALLDPRGVRRRSCAVDRVERDRAALGRREAAAVARSRALVVRTALPSVGRCRVVSRAARGRPVGSLGVRHVQTRPGAAAHRRAGRGPAHDPASGQHRRPGPGTGRVTSRPTSGGWPHARGLAPGPAELPAGRAHRRGGRRWPRARDLQRRFSLRGTDGDRRAPRGHDRQWRIGERPDGRRAGQLRRGAAHGARRPRPRGPARLGRGSTPPSPGSSTRSRCACTRRSAWWCRRGPLARISSYAASRSPCGAGRSSTATSGPGSSRSAWHRRWRSIRGNGCWRRPAAPMRCASCAAPSVDRRSQDRSLRCRPSPSPPPPRSSPNWATGSASSTWTRSTGRWTPCPSARPWRRATSRSSWPSTRSAIPPTTRRCRRSATRPEFPCSPTQLLRSAAPCAVDRWAPRPRRTPTR